LAAEQERHRPGIGHRAAVAGHGGAHLGGCPVTVVGQAFNEKGHPAGTVSLIHDRLIISTAGISTRAALDGSLDVVGGHRCLASLLDRVIQRRVAVWVTTTGACRHLDVFDQFCEELAALRIDHGLLVFGRRPFRMAAHSCSCSSCSRAGLTCMPPPGTAGPSRKRAGAPAGRRSAPGGTRCPARTPAESPRSYRPRCRLWARRGPWPTPRR